MSCCGARVIVEPTPSGTGDVTSANLISTVSGLGTAGYISSLSGDATTGQLTSTTTGIYNYVSSFIFPTELTSSLRGLGTMGYISSSQLISTVAGIGSGGGITNGNLASTVQGLGTAGYISSSQLISTVAGLGTGGGITNANLTSTVQGLGTAGYLSSVTFPAFPMYALSTTSTYNKISLTSNTTIVSDVNIPYASEIDIYRTNTYNRIKGTDLNIIEENVDNQDSNVTKDLAFQYTYDYPPKVTIMPYNTHSLSNVLVPCIRDLTTSNVKYEIYDVTTASLTTDYSFVRILGRYTDIPQVLTFTHNDNFANLQIGSFTTPANLDPDVYVTVFMSNTFLYTAGAGGSYEYYFTPSATPLYTPTAQASLTLGNYPPGCNIFTTFSNSNVPSTIYLQPNLTYYTYFYQPYVTSFSNVVGEISLTYTTSTV